MRRTTLRFTTGAGYGVGLFGPRVRATRLHPRRDPEGHKNGGEGGEGGKTDDKGGDKKDPPAGETPEQRAVREAQEQAAQTQALSQWLVAEAQFNAEQARQATLSEDQREQERQRQEWETTREREIRLEVEGEYAARIDTVTGKYIDSLISGALAAKGLKPESFGTVLGKLDKSNFIGEDGAVNEEEVTKFANELGGAATARPPRTGGTRASADDRGFGRYLPEKNN